MGLTALWALVTLGLPWALAEICWGMTNRRLGTGDEWGALGGAVLGMVYLGVVGVALGR